MRTWQGEEGLPTVHITVKSPIEAWFEYSPVPKQRQFNRVLTWIESSFVHIPSKLREYQMKCVISFILLVIKSRNSRPTPANDENWPKLTCTNIKQISFYIIECFQNFQQKIESWLEYYPVTECQTLNRVRDSIGDSTVCIMNLLLIYFQGCVEKPSCVICKRCLNWFGYNPYSWTASVAILYPSVFNFIWWSRSKAIHGFKTFYD